MSHSPCGPSFGSLWQPQLLQWQRGAALWPLEPPRPGPPGALCRPVPLHVGWGGTLLSPTLLAHPSSLPGASPAEGEGGAARLAGLGPAGF